MYKGIVMVLNESDIDKIAVLAKLKPTEDEKKRLLHDLNRVLEYMEIINELDTDNVAEMSHPDKSPTPLRQDVVKPSLDHDLVVKNAPMVKDGLIAVPKVIKDR